MGGGTLGRGQTKKTSRGSKHYFIGEDTVAEEFFEEGGHGVPS